MTLYLVGLVALGFVLGCLCFVHHDENHEHSPRDHKIKVSNTGQLVAKCSCGKSIRKIGYEWV